MIYFDNAATSYPKPPEVLRIIYKTMTEYGGNPGRSSHSLSLAAAKMVYQCRESIAEHFGGNPENVVFTYNATYALNIAVKSVAGKYGRILISDIEHNAVYRPVTALTRTGLGCDIFHVSDNSDETIKNFCDKLCGETKIVVVNLSSNVCGLSVPADKIGQLCRERGIIFIADASQCAGSKNINMEKCCIDILCAPGHKGLMGPQGCGFAVFGSAFSGENAANLKTFAEGGSGSASLERTMPAFLPERLEAGTLSTPAIAGLLAGLNFVKHIGVDEIADHEKKLFIRANEMLYNTNGVTVYVPQCSGSILLFNIEGVLPSEAAEVFDSDNICVRAGYHCAPLPHNMLKTGKNGAIRASFGAYNRLSELDSFYRVVKKLIK